MTKDDTPPLPGFFARAAACLGGGLSDLPPPPKATAENEWGWPNDRFRDLAPVLASKIGLLIVDESRWVDRRVESVSFVDETTLFRQTSVHFSVPNFPAADFEPEGVALTLIPISMLRKGVMKRFS